MFCYIPWWEYVSQQQYHGVLRWKEYIRVLGIYAMALKDYGHLVLCKASELSTATSVVKYVPIGMNLWNAHVTSKHNNTIAQTVSRPTHLILVV